MKGHFTQEANDERTFCGKDALHVRYATDLRGPALYAVEWLASYDLAPCGKCVERAGLSERGYSPLTKVA